MAGAPGTNVDCYGDLQNGTRMILKCDVSDHARNGEYTGNLRIQDLAVPPTINFVALNKMEDVTFGTGDEEGTVKVVGITERGETMQVTLMHEPQQFSYTIKSGRGEVLATSHPQFLAVVPGHGHFRWAVPEQPTVKPTPKSGSAS